MFLCAWLHLLMICISCCAHSRLVLVCVVFCFGHTRYAYVDVAFVGLCAFFTCTQRARIMLCVVVCVICFPPVTYKTARAHGFCVGGPRDFIRCDAKYGSSVQGLWFVWLFVLLVLHLVVLSCPRCAYDMCIDLCSLRFLCHIQQNVCR